MANVASGYLYVASVLRTLSMAEWAYEKGYFEMTAACARKLAEMYVKICLEGMDVEVWDLNDGLQQLPESTWHMWWALTQAKTLGNAAAHPRLMAMTREAGLKAMSAAVHIADAFMSRARAPRARL